MRSEYLLVFGIIIYSCDNVKTTHVIIITREYFKDNVWFKDCDSNFLSIQPLVVEDSSIFENLKDLKTHSNITVFIKELESKLIEDSSDYCSFVVSDLNEKYYFKNYCLKTTSNKKLSSKNTFSINKLQNDNMV